MPGKSIHSGHATSQNKNQPSSLAVLPFDGSSGSESLAFGLAYTLSEGLRNLEGLRVIPPLLSLAPLGDRSPEEAGRSFNVETVLTGTLDRTGEELRITAMLLDSIAERELLSARFVARKDDLFEIRRLLIRDIAAKASGPGSSRIPWREPADPRVSFDAFEAYSQARMLECSSQDANQQIAALYETAWERAPHYAEAAAALAYRWCVMFMRRQIAPLLLDTALEASRAALQHDHLLPEANAALGMLMTLKGDIKKGERHLRRALSSDPHLSAAHDWLAMALDARGLHQDAARERAWAQASASSFHTTGSQRPGIGLRA